ncbi:MAG: ECF transporter S component [candidate division WOR-3 bacterium]|nr:ECF transporter S component [candidate division WOR-3 bacterium]
MNNLKLISRITIFTALAISLGYVFSFVPNLELITSTIFLAGVFLGCRPGMLVGLLSFLIFGFLNPLGPSPLPLLITQIIGGMFAGFLGGIYRKKEWDKAYILVLLGIFITFTYDILTTSAGFFFFPTKKTFLAYLVVGLPFVLWHILTQSIIYGFILTPIIRRLKKRR